MQGQRGRMGVLEDFAALDDALDLVDHEGADTHCSLGESISLSHSGVLLSLSGVGRGRGTHSLSGSGCRFGNWSYLHSAQLHCGHRLRHESQTLTRKSISTAYRTTEVVQEEEFTQKLMTKATRVTGAIQTRYQQDSRNRKPWRGEYLLVSQVEAFVGVRGGHDRRGPSFSL